MSFQEIYEKRRTRTFKQEVFVVDPEGGYIYTVEKGLTEGRYTPKVYMNDEMYVRRSDGKNWNNALSNLHSNHPVVYYKLKASSKTVIRDRTIAGTAPAVFASVWELLLTSRLIWLWFVGFVTDGYWLVFASPFIHLNWILATILYIPLFFLLSILLLLSFVWTLVFEVPASILNREKVPFFEGGVPPQKLVDEEEVVS